MKRLLFIALLLYTATTIAQDNTVASIKWHTNLETAQKIAKTENKPILMYFTGSDWCPPCIALKEDLFKTESFKKYVDQFVLVEIDRPRRLDIISQEQMEYNKKVIIKYNKNKSFPLLLLLNKNGDVKDKISGYSSYNTYKDMSYHIKFLDKALTTF